MSVTWLYLICSICSFAFEIGNATTKWISIDYGSVKTQYSDLVFVIDTEIDEWLLAEVKVKIISLLRRVHLGKDRVRVAIIENGQNSYNPYDYDVESTMICKPKECIDLATIEARINQLRRKKVTPCSFFLQGVREVLYNRANGARPPGNKGAKDIVVLVQTFCCDDLTDIERTEEILDLRRGNSDRAIFFIALKLQAANCRHKSLELPNREANSGYATYFTSDFSDLVISVLEQFPYPGQAAVGCTEKYGVTQCAWDDSRSQCRRDTIPGSSIHDLCLQFGSKKPYKQNIFDVDKEGYHVCAEIKGAECRSFESLGKRFCSSYKMRKELPLFKSYLPELTPETDLVTCFKSMPEFAGCKQNIQPNMPQYMDMAACDAITTHEPTTSTTKLVTPEPLQITTTSSTQPATTSTKPTTSTTSTTTLVLTNFEPETTTSTKPAAISTGLSTTTSPTLPVSTSIEPANTTSTTEPLTTYTNPKSTISYAEPVTTDEEKDNSSRKTVFPEPVTTNEEKDNSSRKTVFTEPVTRRSSTVSSFPIVTFVSALFLMCIIIFVISAVLLIVRRKNIRPAGKNIGLSAKTTIAGKSAACSTQFSASNTTSMSKHTRSTFTSNKSKKSKSKPRCESSAVKLRKAKGAVRTKKR